MYVGSVDEIVLDSTI